MTISYTALLGLAQPVTGTETGQWGTVVNDEITALLEDAVANAASISVTAGNVTLSTTNGSSNQARMSTLIITGTPGTTRNVVAPSQAKIYVVINQSDGAVVIKGAATSGVTIGAGQTAQVAWNGSDFVEIGNYVHGNFVVNGNLSVNGDSTLGNAGADTTTINGQVIAANSNISKTTTLSASAPALAWIKGATYTDTGTAGGTTQALAPFTVFSTPTLSTSNIVTYTDAATVYIAGAPAAAGSATITNPYSLYVAAGDAYFGASVVLNAGTANGVPYLNASKVLTTGSALTFDGTNLGVNSASPIDGGRFSVAFAGNTQNGIGLKDTADASGASFWGAYNSTGGFIGSLRRSSTDNALAINGNSYLAFQQNSTELMRLTSTGLGIGTNNPAYKLDVNGTGSIISATRSDTNRADIIVTNSGGTVSFGINNSTGSWLTNGLPYYGYILGPSNASYGLQFGVGASNTAAVTIDPSGNLGLGVTPTAAYGGLQIVGPTSASLYTQQGIDVVRTGVRASGRTGIVFDSSDATYTNRMWYIANEGASGSLDIGRSGLSVLTMSNSGNLGLGVTPSAWGTTPKALQVGAVSSFVDAGLTFGTNVGYNCFTDNFSDKYIQTGFASAYNQRSGEHRWYNAPSGTAGNAVSFTQAMTLDALGNLVVGATSTSSRFEAVAGTGAQFIGAFRTGDATAGNNAGGGFYGISSATAATREATLWLDADGANFAGGDYFYIQKFGNSGVVNIVNYSNAAMTFYTNTAERARISADGTFRVKGAGTAGTTDAVQFSGSAPASTLILDSSGRLGVGTSSPNYLIHSQTTSTNITTNLKVDADAAANNYAEIAFQLWSGAGTGLNTFGGGGNSRPSVVLRALSEDASARGAFVVATFSGGTTNATLTEKARITSGGDLLVGKTVADFTTVGCYIDYRGTFNSAAASIDYLNCYNTTAGLYRFYVSNAGTINATSSTINTISDQRLKENIQDLDVGISAVMSLKPRKFDWKSGKGKDIKGDRGFIAQEFEQVFPDMVGTWKDPAPEGEEPYKSVCADLIPVLVKAIQEQQAMINELKAEVAALKGA